jgi:hypothetical protein
MQKKLTKKQVIALLVDADMSVKNDQVKYKRKITKLEYLLKK